ncbi:MAG: GNAT family N-acetyltransferase [Bacteroidota bacterium]|jgi:GNAT superfamily N-acetyltransferase
MTTISFATEQDVHIIQAFIEGIAEYEKLSHEVETTPDKLRKTLFGERPYAEVLIARELDVPVGFALFFHNYSTFRAKPGIYLEDLFVLPEHRGKGHGKALFTQVLHIARERGCGRMEWCVLDWNKPAIDFYLNMGAKPMDEWTTFRITL